MIDRSFHAHNKELGSAVLFYVAGIALLTLLVNGTTMEWLLTKLGLSEVSRASAQAFDFATLELAHSMKRLVSKMKVRPIHVRPSYTRPSVLYTSVLAYSLRHFS